MNLLARSGLVAVFALLGTHAAIAAPPRPAIGAAAAGRGVSPGGVVLVQMPARVKDVSELCAELGPVATRHPLRLRVAYHDACHLAHGQGIRRQPRALLASIPGVELLEIPDADQCCGSAGDARQTRATAAAFSARLHCAT